MISISLPVDILTGYTIESGSKKHLFAAEAGGQDPIGLHPGTKNSMLIEQRSRAEANKYRKAAKFPDLHL